MKGSLVKKKDPVQQARNKCLRKFLFYFRSGYRDAKYIAWEREYKWDAHLQFQAELNKADFKRLLNRGKYNEIANTAARIESKTNLLFSFEKMALRDAIKSPEGAKDFAYGLYNYIYGDENLETRFNEFVEVVGKLPRKQTRVLTWPLLSVFGFIANPKEHIFLKPRVTQIAAEKYNFPFQYRSKPDWNTYQSLFDFAEDIRKQTNELTPKDYIDLQSFIWVMGSLEYPD